MSRPETRRALVVVDLGFGDCGKGLLTDHLVRGTGARLVVRFNGGAQAGHNVVTPDGRHHTFSQFGAGSFLDGVRTFLSRHVVVHPTALLVEAAALETRGVPDPLARIRVSERARIVTPFHQALGRLRELARGRGRHGSCGAGVGEAVRDALEHRDDAIAAGDLRDPGGLHRKLRRARDRLGSAVDALRDLLPDDERVPSELAVFARETVVDRWILDATQVAGRGVITADATLTTWMREAGTTVFEGAQGVLLDERAGFHPFTTWSRCTDDNARELIAEQAPGTAVERIGVLRAHAVRHGPGPLPTETGALSSAIMNHNANGPWQGPVRYGWFDAVLARYALDVCGVDRLAVTHLDVPARLGTWRMCRGYQVRTGDDDDLVRERRSSAIVTRLAALGEGGLARQERLTQLLLRANPLLDDAAPSDVVEALEEAIGRSVDLVSWGPRADTVGAPSTWARATVAPWARPAVRQ